MTTPSAKQPLPEPWIPLHVSLAFLIKNPRILGWSTLLVVLTGTLTWLGYLKAILLVDGWTGHFFLHPPDTEAWWAWFSVKGWLVLKYFFLAVSRIVAFYLAFLTAYCLTCPGYVFLATATEKKYTGGHLTADQGLTLRGTLIDFVEGCKIGLLGLFVTVIALLLNFIPMIGQGLVFLLYTFPDVC